MSSALSKFLKPSVSRDWIPEQAVLPRAEFTADAVHVRNVRDWDWRGDGDPVARYADSSFALDRVESVWYVLTPFARHWRGPAHSFLSFGFDDAGFLAISVEARKEVGETYSPLGGLLRRYELMYVIGTEQDLIGLRVFRYDGDVYVYPIRATKEAIRSLFVDMLKRANELASRPEFYGTLRNNCTTNILEHVNRLAPRRIRFGPRVLLPGYSDALAHDLGLLDTELPLDAARDAFRVNDRVREHIDSATFSRAIRTP